MKIRKRTFYRLLLFVLPDFLLALFLVLFFFTDLVSDFSIIMLGLILALLFARSIIYL